jgi:hypothetical protein
MPRVRERPKPRSRNGRKISQIIGYSTSKMMAKGQQSTNKMAHKTKFVKNLIRQRDDYVNV